MTPLGLLLIEIFPINQWLILFQVTTENKIMVQLKNSELAL